MAIRIIKIPLMVKHLCGHKREIWGPNDKLGCESLIQACLEVVCPDCYDKGLDIKMTNDRNQKRGIPILKDKDFTQYDGETDGQYADRVFW